MEINNKEKIKSIDKAIDVLEFLSKIDQEIGISQISKQLGMGLSTVHRILLTLKSRGYIIQNQKTIKYRLGIKLFELGCEVQSAKSLIQNVRPFMRKLSKETLETVNLAILEQKEVVYLYTIESSEILKTGIRQGTRVPAHCTALGKVLLSFLDDKQFENLYNKEVLLVSRTHNSISSYSQLTKEISKIRTQGYAVDLQEFMEGINCVSCPILNSKREAIAAISLTGPSTRFDLHKINNFKNILKNVTNEISKDLYLI